VSMPRPASCWRTAPKAHKPIKKKKSITQRARR
jgi:hypothetical protein